VGADVGTNSSVDVDEEKPLADAVARPAVGGPCEATLKGT
jgi:hypothetical protein